MQYRIRFTVKKRSRDKRCGKHTYGQVRGTNLHVGRSEAGVVHAIPAAEATLFDTYEQAVAAVSFWMLSDDWSDWQGMWVKNPRIERV